MNADLKDAFSRIKPVCDVLMVCPTEDSIAAYLRRVAELKKEVIQELQQYLLFPLITHLKSTETEKKHELQRKLVDCMRTVLEKVVVNSFEMCMKMEIGLLQIVFDHTKPGMVADVPEELKCSVMTCLTVLLLNVDPKYREVMLKAHVPLLGKAVYVSVHLAKLERLRALRLAAIQCVTAHTATHPQLTTDYHITDPLQEKLVVDMLSLILPGVMGALQDVATCKDNPGHALIVTAIDAMHRILCLAMNNKYMNQATEPTAEDFMNVYRQKGNKEVSNKVDPKTLPVRSVEWFKVASQKVLIINQHIVALRTHEHFKVRKELAIYFARMLVEFALALDTLILLSKDEYPEVSEYCRSALSAYFENASEETRSKTLDSLCKNFFTAVNGLPRVMNNIDVISPPPVGSPWCKLRHLDDEQCERRVQEILSLLGEAECASLLLDQLLELFELDRSAEVVYVCNWMAAAPNSSEDSVKRILNTYLEEDVWYLPLEVGVAEPALNPEDTLDVNLYEGAIETRYTDISYRVARTKPHTDPNKCATLGDAQRNMLLSCLLTEGVGVIARRLMDKYQPFLLKTLCLVLERVGSKYEMLHLAGLKAIHGIAVACGHATVADLIKHNADYFTNQVTVRLKKAWNCQSALQILSVVMEYSDSSILNYLYGIVEDVLVQSCDKYYEKDLQAYLQVFLTFVECIRKWYEIPEVEPKATEQNREIDILNDLLVFVENRETEERLLNDEEFENRAGRSVEEMYREDMRRREEEMLDYDDTVTEEKPPLPQHVTVTVTILKRCLNYVTSSQRDNSILALQVLTRGLPILRKYDDELLPLVHKSWGPLISRFDKEPTIMKRAFDLLVTMAELARDFIRGRAISQAYSLQLTALAALPHLATDLMLEDEALENAMTCVQPYLSKKQPKALQSLAVEFFKRLLDYNHGATWYHLRTLCNNDQVLEPPTREYVHLFQIVGSPYVSTDKDYQSNIKLIFDNVS
ncbi:hypothetical protein HF086_014041 [Spodoptera exigua]|uniref:TELO2-interacting protein 1 homolog n=1 Tax=Spodoptera exigua TaxID=7107 RepID=A0A922MM41_SPOEX|nr:hypothetical protein HF086_014041 [Spodoptera exigua]